MLRSPNTVPKTKFWFLIGLTFVLHSLLLYRFFQLQVLDYDLYKQRANSNRIRANSVPAPRGLILDRKGKIIVDNYPTYVLFGIGDEIINSTQNFSVISKATGIDTSYLSINYKNNFRSRFLPTKLAKDLTISQLSRLEEYKNDLSGIIYKQYPERIFNSSIRASHVLGYLKELDQEFLSYNKNNSDYQFGDLIGWSGLESKYEYILRGKKGVSYYQVDAYGREAGKIKGQKNISASPGNDIITTLDLELQELLEKELNDIKGAGIVSNPKTGGLLAYVSSPDYPPDLFTGLIATKDWETVITDKDKPLLDRVSNGLYPPGSIYKMIVAVELLERKLVTESWEVFCPGYYEFYDRTFKCWNENGHGNVNLEKAIVESCDVYFYQAIQKVEIDNLSERSKMFHHGKKTNIDLPSEMKGRVPTYNYMNKKYGKWGWSKGALLNISIGQGELLVTPLQVALYTNILATRGETYTLHLVNNKPNKLNKINIRNSTWKLLEKAMRAVIISPKGTGRRADPKIKGLDIFGKTGTAENPHGEPHAWFIGYGLKNDKMISIVIMLENGGHGGEVAAPIARSIFKKYFENDYKIAIK